MRRRDFFSAIPAAAVAAPAQNASKPDRGTVTIIPPEAPHPRLGVALENLTALLRRLGYSAVQGQGNASRGATVRLHRAPGMAVEHFEVTTAPGVVNLRALDDRSLVYAVAELQRQTAFEGALPASMSLRRQPRFAVRRWSTAVSHRFGSPWDERIHIAQRLAYIKSEILPKAAEYGMSSVELNGRPGDGWDTDWVIGFEKYPELARLFPKGERRERLALVEDVARAAHDNMVELLVWGHELHLPPGFTELYPQVKGTEYPVCLSSEFLKKFIRDKYIEFFTGAPSVDGLVLSVNESGQFSLITDAGCKCDRCRRMTQHDRLMTVLKEVITVATDLKKQLVLRTFQGSFVHDLYGHPELETIRKAYSGLPQSVQVMSKYCPLDFYGGEIADEPLIGVFPNPHLVEFSLDVEWQGRTFVPVLTPENFRRRITHAIDKKCHGIVARVDFPFPTMEPEPIFGHPNEFNAWWMGELLWQPAAKLDESLARWTKLRYGAAASPLVASALSKTEAITQKTFFALGHTLINYHNMIASISHSDGNLWQHALSKWDPSKRKLSESYFEPDESLLERCRAEKHEAIALATAGLGEIHKAAGKLPVPEYQRLRYDFEKLRDTAELWNHLTQLYLLHRRAGSSPAKPERIAATLAAPDRVLASLLERSHGALLTARRMEELHGQDCWPVASPDRGVTAYQFVHEILRHYIAGMTGEPAKEVVKSRYSDSVVTGPVIEPDSTESFWRKLVECGRPAFTIERTADATWTWPSGLDQVRFENDSMRLISGPRSLRLPLPFPVKATSIDRSTKAFTIRKAPGHLDVSARRTV